MLRWFKSSAPAQDNKWKLDVFDAVFSKRRYGGDPKLTQTEWTYDRFQHWHTRGVAVISGSTYANDRSHLEGNNEQVLDAAAARKYYDQDGVLKKSVCMTLDGLGHHFEVARNTKISGDNKLMVAECDEALLQSSDIAGILTTAGNAVLQQREKEADQDVTSTGENRFILTEDGSAIAIAIVEYNEAKKQMQCQLANVGDTMAVVLDGTTLALKDVLAAREYVVDIKGNMKSAPIPAHLISHNPDALLTKTLAVSPNDVIILMTDGIFKELTCEKKEDKLENKETSFKYELKKTAAALSYIDTKLTANALEPAFAALSTAKVEANEHEIAASIMKYIKTKLADERAKKARSLVEFKEWAEKHEEDIRAHCRELQAAADGRTKSNCDQYTVGEWFKWKSDHANTAADKLYSFEGFKKDLNKYLPTLHQCFPESSTVPLEERTVSELLKDISKAQLKAGGCATLSVMRVPDPDIELARAWIDYPEHRENIMLRFTKCMTDKMNESKSFNGIAWRSNIIDKLKAETCIAPGSRGETKKNLQLSLVYSAKQLDELNQAMTQIDIQVKLKQMANKEYQAENKNVAQQQEEFQYLKNNKKLLPRKHSIVDRLLGINNTKTWKAGTGQMRKQALNSLKQEVNNAQNDGEKIKTLEAARKMSLFAEHRNNSVLFGAFGRTQAVKEIDNQLKALRKPKKV